MPQCENCGAYVSKKLAQVKWKRTDTVPACPNCEDAKLMDGQKYEYRN